MLDLFAPIEIPLYLVMGVLEIVVVLVAICFFLYRKVKLYKPHYQANTRPDDYIRSYLKLALEHTRKYAQSLEADANNGVIDAMKKRVNLVARINWLTLERDFVSNVVPNHTYWDDISYRIQKMLKRWEEAEVMELPPLETAVSALLSESSENMDIESFDPEKHDIRRLGPQGDTDDRLRERVRYLEKQVVKLASYKTLYFGLQNTYEGMQKSYKTLKRKIQELSLDAAESEHLKGLLAEHEQAEKAMENQMAQVKERMAAELNQLEDAYIKLEEEHIATLEERTNNLPDPLSAMPEISNTDYMDDPALMQSQELTDNLDNQLREFRGFLHSLSLDTDTKLEIDDKSADIERTNQEIKTCINMLEMERDRLQKEVHALHGHSEPTEEEDAA